MIVLPSVAGAMGVTVGHVPTMTEIHSGVVAITSADETQKYFISGGYAMIHPDSVVDISVAEAIKLEDVNIDVKTFF